MEVIKRDGRVVDFDPTKIVVAVNKAFNEVDGEITPKANTKAKEIAKSIESLDRTLGVEEIQDLVEDKLMASNRKDVARAYIIYRNERTKHRESKSNLVESIANSIGAKDVKNQNANVDEKSFGGRMGSATSEVMKDFALKYCVSKMAAENHLGNMIYIHDLDHYAVGDHNCLSIPFDDLLANGFNTRQTDVRPAQSANTAFQLVAVLFQLQSLQQFGGVSATHLDWTMVPYVRKSFYKHFKDGVKYIADISDRILNDINDTLPIDSEVYPRCETYQYAIDMTVKETYQAVEGMYHNLNTLQSRSGNQLPFTSINYGTCTLPEGRLVTKAILDVSIDGIGKLHKTPIFPCGIFQCMKGVNRHEGDPNYDLFRLALKSTATRLYPNYANVDWSGNSGYDVNDPTTYFSTMGCRTANGFDINAEPGVNPQRKDGRGNICPVTIILPTLAMEAKQKTYEEMPLTAPTVLEHNFMTLLDQKIHEAKDMLIERYRYICSQSPESARFMYENNVMAGYDGKNIESALRHGTLAIGQLGLAEALQILVGCDHTESRGMELAKKIEELFMERCAEFKVEYKLNFGVYYTPAENLCHTAMKKFRDKWGALPHVSDKEFFTNSMHVPVWKEISPFDKIDIESQLTGYSSAGCITYIELDGGVKHNIDALEQIVNYAMDKDIPYFAVNVPNDTCLDCGFTGEFNDQCPMCGSSNIQQLRRVTGLSDNC